MRALGFEFPRRLSAAISRLSLTYGAAIPIIFGLVSLPIFVFIGWHLVNVEQDGSTQTLVQATESHNTSLAQTFANAHADPIAGLLANGAEGVPGLQASITEMIRGTGVIDVKLYDAHGINLFSLTHEKIGKDISGCECFSAAMEHSAYSELFSESIGDHGHGGDPQAYPHADGSIDLLTTMIRIDVPVPGRGTVAGVLEIQSDITELVGAVLAMRRNVSIVVGVPVAALYVTMVAIVVLGHTTILRRERQAAQLAAWVAESDASSRAKTEFLSLMSHELRTPLNAIIGFAQLIADSARNAREDETADWADAVHESGLHMTRVVTSILDLTALELGEFELEREPLHLPDVVRRAVNAVWPAFDNGLVSLNIHDDHGQDPVTGDPRKLGQVFENLLANAARFTPAGGTVDVEFGTGPHGFASVSIRDTGAGMTAQQIAHARRPFQANWEGYSRKTDGIGLGLTIADRVVKGLGGELLIESEADAGTLITVRLPVYRLDNSNIAAFQPDQDRVPANDATNAIASTGEKHSTRGAIG